MSFGWSDALEMSHSPVTDAAAVYIAADILAIFQVSKPRDAM